MKLELDLEGKIQLSFPNCRSKSFKPSSDESVLDVSLDDSFSSYKFGKFIKEFKLGSILSLKKLRILTTGINNCLSKNLDTNSNYYNNGTIVVNFSSDSKLLVSINGNIIASGIWELNNNRRIFYIDTLYL